MIDVVVNIIDCVSEGEAVRMRVKICLNKKCRDSYNLGHGFTKWKEDFKECPTCRSKLKLKIIK